MPFSRSWKRYRKWNLVKNKVKEHKVLGVIIENKLNFQSHTNELCKNTIADGTMSPVNCHETKTSACLFETSAQLSEYAPTCFKQVATSFHIRNFFFLNLQAPVRNGFPPTITGEHLFWNITYSKFSLDIWSWFFVSLSLVWF